MATIRAHIKNGRIEPLEPVTLPEGTEVDVVIPEKTRDLERFWASFGSWKDIGLDFDEWEGTSREPQAHAAGARTVRYLLDTDIAVSFLRGSERASAPPQK